MRRLPIYLLLFLPLSVWTQQNLAGPDRYLCTGSSVEIGQPSTCSDCCYLWSPSNGLDDPSKPNPIVSGLTVSTVYAVTVSYPDGNYIADDVQITVYESDLSVYEPEYFQHNTLIPDNEEQYPGAQTFVNLDNDDCDAHFDREDDVVQNGDNEFIKIHLFFSIKQLQRPGRGSQNTAERGPGDYQAALDLAGNTSISGLRLWKSADKSAGEYITGDPLELTPTGLIDYEAWLWAEGTEAHTLQQQVQFLSRFYDDPEPICTGDVVSITVVGFQKIEWVGINNGFTGDGRNNSNTLDLTESTNPAAGVRVFPEGKFISPTNISKTQDTVILKITLSVTPARDHHFYLRPFDIDDPSTDVTFIDPNDTPPVGLSGQYTGQPYGLDFTPDEDNRGKPNPLVSTGDFSTGGSRAGQIFGPDIIVTSSLKRIFRRINVTSNIMTIKFKVSNHPGDNYKIAVCNDTSLLVNLRNLDIFDGQNIVDQCTSPNNAAGCIPINTTLSSPAITVWRTLHLEYDRMRNPTWDDNLIVKGTFNDFSGTTFKNAIAISGIRPDSIYNSLFVDPSRPLADTSIAPRRFEHGGLRIGKPEVVICTPFSAGGIVPSGPRIQRNGNHELLFASFTDLTSAGTLPGKLAKGGQPILPFMIENIERLYIDTPDFKVKLTLPVSNLTNYQNGDVSIGGGPFSTDHQIQVLDNQHFIIKRGGNGLSQLKIPVEVRDDDAIPIGGTSNLIQETSLMQAQETFGEVYIDVRNDGGGIIANNGSNLLFSRNIGDGNLYDSSPIFNEYLEDDSLMQSINYGISSYWCAYVIAGWQSPTSTDGDPEIERTIRALTLSKTDTILATGGRLVMLFLETCRETNSALNNGIISTERTLAHELGHAFGLTHGDDCLSNSLCSCYGVSSLSNMGIMTSEQPYPSTSFISYQKNILRCKRKSPGKK